MELARSRCDVLVASIYVNPLQFAPTEDLSRYPRDASGDASKCQQAGVDLLFTPESLYPSGFCTRVAVQGLTSRWEGASRPGHFEGVVTVVARLFGIVGPDIAVFGEKDFQQLAVLRAMTRDLLPGIEIIGGPLVRDSDGLALSSRNVYLSQLERSRALSLNRALSAMRACSGSAGSDRLALGKSLIDCDQLDYLCIVDEQSLEPVETIDRPVRALVVGRYGKTRLLDNAQLSPEPLPAVF
jgi:pantoate--beta-alanine ligase